MPTFEFRDVQGRTKKFEAANKFLGRHILTIGVQGSDGTQRYASGATVATVAAITEFGSPGNNIPERSWLRSAMREQANQIAQAWERELTEVYAFTKTARDAYAAVGHEIVELVKAKFDRASSWALPNTLETLKSKGVGKRPLEDTGRLRGAITWAIRAGGVDGPVLEQGT